MFFSAAQQAAISPPTWAAEVLVVAGPGSGKTTVVIERIFHLVTELGVQPEEIAAITFTNKAARELNKRLGARLKKAGLPGCRLGYCGTIHGLCLRLLEKFGAPIFRPGLAVLDEEQAAAALRGAAILIGYPKLSMSKLLEARDKFPVSGKPSTQRPEMLVAATYYKQLRQANATDFEGLLREAKIVLGDDGKVPHGFQFLFVDERQDVGREDMVIKALRTTNRRYRHFFVGDPDQAIYGFRGGNLDIIMQDAERVGVKLKLEENFRSDIAICAAAQRLIEHNKLRLNKATISVSKDAGAFAIRGYESSGLEKGFVCSAIADLLAAGVEPTEIAVLARTNAVADDFRNYSRASHNWPLEDDRAAVAPHDAIYARAYLAMVAAPGNDLAAEFFIRARDGDKIADEAKRDAAIKQRSLCSTLHLNGIRRPEGLHDLALAMHAGGCSQESIDYWCDLIPELPEDATISDLLMAERFRERTQARKAGIAVTTMHAAKGREWSHVFLIGVEQQIIPGKGDIEEERRVMYVAITRAKHSLRISYAKQRALPFGNRTVQLTQPSQFIGEILE